MEERILQRAMQKLYLEALIVRQGEAERKMLEGKRKENAREDKEGKEEDEIQQLSQLSAKDLLKFITFGAQKILTTDGKVCSPEMNCDVTGTTIDSI